MLLRPGALLLALLACCRCGLPRMLATELREGRQNGAWNICKKRNARPTGQVGTGQHLQSDSLKRTTGSWPQVVGPHVLPHIRVLVTHRQDTKAVELTGRPATRAGLPPGPACHKGQPSSCAGSPATPVESHLAGSARVQGPGGQGGRQGPLHPAQCAAAGACRSTT